MTAARGSWRGPEQVLQYNLPVYLGAIVILISGVVLYQTLQPDLLADLLLAGLFLIAFWMTTSLFVSHWIYDCSPLYEWEWLRYRFAQIPDRWLVIHAGLDETSSALRRIFPESQGFALDVFDPRDTPETSIIRARRQPALQATARASLRQLPVIDRSVNVVFLVFTVHEIRKRESRLALMSEIRRILDRNGILVVIEHARDLLNFAAFGPGFLHFLPRSAWLNPARAMGFSMTDDPLSFTPFVQAHFLRTSEEGVDK